MTICVLTYGNHPHLFERTLQAIRRHSLPFLYELRIGLNAPSKATVAVLDEWLRTHPCTQYILSEENLYKCRLMRALFALPSSFSRWTIWFDDDSYPTRPDWMQRLISKIHAYPDIDAWGKPFCINLQTEICRFIESAAWYRGRPWFTKTDAAGNFTVCLPFLAGGFWAARTEVLRALDWPDPRLIQAGDDFVFGEALRQNGFRIGRFEHGVAFSDAPRRNPRAKEIRELPHTPVRHLWESRAAE